MSHRVALPKIGTFEAWREAARAHLRAATPPEAIRWSRGAAEADLFGSETGSDSGALPSGDRPVRVTKAALDTLRLVICHSDPQRFARAYAALARMQDRPGLFADRADPAIARLQAMAKEVRRDRHKMTAFVRFREVDPVTPDRRRFAAWFEPAHFIAEATAPFFANRFGDMDWAIFTPDMTVRFDGQLRFDAAVARPDLPPDATEDLWRTYFASIFNPARVKPRAMQSEMPKKYWKNLPEADLIPQMLAQAEARARAMAEAAPTLAPARAARITEGLRQDGETRFLEALHGCTRCDLCHHATQVVPGQGARGGLMLVGEQPGEEEDLAGRPFIGPAGRVLDQALERAGIDRATTYLTNAVKHFKFTQRGKTRLHQAPNAGEVRHCRWWLDLERERVQPRLIVAMGATAALALTGRKEAITARRGTLEAAEDGTPVLLTWHPSRVLRLPDPRAQARAMDELSADLGLGLRLLSRAEGVRGEGPLRDGSDPSGPPEAARH